MCVCVCVFFSPPSLNQVGGAWPRTGPDARPNQDDSGISRGGSYHTDRPCQLGRRVRTGAQPRNSTWLGLSPKVHLSTEKSPRVRSTRTAQQSRIGRGRGRGRGGKHIKQLNSWAADDFYADPSHRWRLIVSCKYPGIYGVGRADLSSSNQVLRDTPWKTLARVATWAAWKATLILHRKPGTEVATKVGRIVRFLSRPPSCCCVVDIGDFEARRGLASVLQYPASGTQTWTAGRSLSRVCLKPGDM